MAKKTPSNRQRLEHLQGARSATIDELHALDTQLTELEQHKAAIETALDDPEQAATAGDLGGILTQLTSLGRVRDSLDRRKGSQDDAIRELLAVVNRDAILAARPGERERFEAVIAAARALWTAIEEYDTYLHERLYPHRGSALTVVPHALISLLRPGLHGGFKYWANTDKIGPVA